MVASYPTSTPWEGFVAQTVLLAVLGGLGQGLLIGLAAAAGEPLYRAAFPRLLALAPGFTWRGALTRPGATALVVGALLAPVMAAYQVVYYAIGQAVGFWSPADLPYENIFSAPAPWLLPASVGYTAATFEEFTFRLFAIPLLAGLFARLVRRRGAALCAAIVVSAVVWAFLHSTYPQDPFFARGLEITLAGIAFGFLMVRFGILASLAVHYTFDAFDSALVLANANALPTSLAAYAITAVPLAVGAFAFARAWRRGGFPSAGPLRNGALARAAAPAAAVRVAAPRAWVYERLSTRRRVAAGGLGVVGLAAALGLGGLTQEHPFAFGRAEAVARAAAAVRALGVDPAGWRAVATLESRSAEPAAAYLREVGGRAAVKELYGPFIPTTAWEVRFTRPRVADEYRVELLPDAAAADGPFAVAARLGETTPGGRLGEAEARWLALAYVATRPGWAGKTPLVVESSTQERPSRTDHALTLAQAGVWYGEAEARAELNVVGDQVSGYRPLVKLPEAWERARSATRVQDVAAIGLVGLFGLVVVGLAVARLVGLARAHRLPRRPALWAAGGFAALDLVGELNGLPLFFQGYETALPEETYAAGRLAGMVALLVLGAAVAGAVAPLLLALWRERFGAGLVPAAEARRDWGLDGALCGLVLPLAGLGVAGAAGALGVDLPLVRSAGTAGVATAAPFVAALAGLRWTLLGLAAGMAGYLIVRERVGGDRWALLLCGAAPVVAAVLARSPVEAAEACGGMLALLVAAAGAARWLLRANLLAYFVAAAAWALVGAAVPLVQARDAFL
ncbi:MAG TPA: CPBP family intramembrane glutamic endopeptidase, partial [Chloroflexota bacterium]|nr:CPBP family intramembrane glutamic endopeptidase [Chloroflexota bacterium]